jgi:ligand-binding sensor domain-containing protein
MRKLCVLLLVLVFIISCKGQNSVSSLKDKNGNIWFTVSERGVYRHDGKSFANFTKENYSLNIHVSACIYEDKAGNLWFNTNKGVCYYDGKKFMQFKIPLPPSSIVGPEKHSLLLINPIQVSKILQDKNGSFWFLTENHGVYRYDTSLSDSVKHEKSFTNFLLDETPNCILETKKGDIYIGSWRGGGVYRYNPLALLNAGKKNEEGFTRLNGFSDGMISCFLEDKAGNIWVGTRNSTVDRYDGKTVTNFSEKDGLSKNGVFCILEDSKGNIWLGSNAGKGFIRGDAFCYDGKTFTNITAKVGLTLVDGFVYDVRSILEDKVGNIWIGSTDGLLLCYDGKRFTNFSEKLLK